jgi:hypothetical protein
MWSVIWNVDGVYKVFTNMIFESEKKAIEFKDKQTQFRKKHDARVVKFNYKYFKGVNENEIEQ